MDFVRGKLLPGGVLFLSYNCMPGWTTLAPVQRLILEIGKRSTRQSIEIVNESMNLLEQFTRQPNGFASHNSGLKARIEKMARQDRNYLAHEFLNSGWEPLYVTDVINDCATAKMTYVGSATLIENHVDLCVQPSFQPLVNTAPDIGMHELLKDFAINKQFRRDLYVKGPLQLSQRDRRERLGACLFARAQISQNSAPKFRNPIGEIRVEPSIILTVTECVAEKPATGHRILGAIEKAGLNNDAAITALVLLVNASVIAPARPDFATVDRTASDHLNSIVMELALSSDTHKFLASTVLGSAVATTFFDRVAALAIGRHQNAAAKDLARISFGLLAEHGQHFQRGVATLEPTDSNVAEVAKLIDQFKVQRLPVWNAWGISPNPQAR